MTKLGFKRSDTLSHVTADGTVTAGIAYRRIIVKQGIETIDGHRVRFVDGTEAEFDTLIAATGYRIDLDILPPEVVNVQDNRLDLYLRIVPPGWPRLSLMGFFNTDAAPNMVFEHQARWVREHLLGNASLPTAKPKVRAEGRFGTSPFALFAYFAVQSSLLRRPYPAVTPGPTARKPPRRSARFSTANDANNANGPATTQAPGEAFDLRTRVAGSDSLSLRSVNRER